VQTQFQKFFQGPLHKSKIVGIKSLTVGRLEFDNVLVAAVLDFTISFDCVGQCFSTGVPRMDGCQGFHRTRPHSASWAKCATTVPCGYSNG